MQTAQVVHRMVKEGHEVAVAANYGASVMMNCAHGHPIFAEGVVKYSLDSAPDAMNQWIGDQPGFGVVLFDLWPLLGSEALRDMKLACWTPVDHDPAPPAVIKFLKDGQHHAIAMSEFGAAKLAEAGIGKELISYIPHAIDRSVWQDKGQDARQQIGVPEHAHLTVINAANRGRVPIRKAFAEMIEGWWAFAKDKKDAHLMIHTEPNGYSEGMNLPRFVASIGADAQRIRYPHPMHFRNGIPDTSLAAMYSAANVMLATSMGEGFGIPVIEAQSCGTPAIVSDFSAQPELLGPHGVRISGQHSWDEYQQSFWTIPNIKEITQALHDNHDETSANFIDRKAVAESMARYDADKVYEERWRPMIERMTSYRKPALTQTMNRAQRRAAKG
jgi:glycosyltransferase involved in cell wall biosynthesis